MSTQVQFMGKVYSSVEAMPAKLRKAYQSKAISLNDVDYTSVAAMPPDVRAEFEQAYKQDPDEYEEWLEEDEDEDDAADDDADSSATAAPAWGGARPQGSGPTGSVPVPAGFESVTGLGQAVEAHPHKGLQLFPNRGTPRATVLVRYRDGLAYQAGGKEVHAWRWEEVAAIQTNDTRHPVKDNSWTSHEYTLTKQSGDKLIVDDEIKGVWDAVEHIKTAVYALMRPALKQRYQAGVALAFGAVTVHQQHGLTLDGQTYAWDSIQDVKVEKGQLKVTQQNGKKHAAHTAAIPNIELLCQIIGVKLDDWDLATEALF